MTIHRMVSQRRIFLSRYKWNRHQPSPTTVHPPKFLLLDCHVTTFLAMTILKDFYYYWFDYMVLNCQQPLDSESCHCERQRGNPYLLYRFLLLGLPPSLRIKLRRVDRHYVPRNDAQHRASVATQECLNGFLMF